MYKQAPFTKDMITRSSVARQKGGRFRFFDPVTARMSGWVSSARPTVSETISEVITADHPAIQSAMRRKAQAAALNAAAAKIDAQQLASVTTAAYDTMTVPALRDLAKARGLKVGSRETRTKVLHILARG